MSQADWLDKDFYKVLGVSKKADAAEIKKSYRKLARELHPDTNPDPKAEDKFKAVSEAYDVLGNAERRKEYDELRALGPAARFRFGGAGGQGGGAGAQGFSPSDFGDMFGRAGQAAAGGMGDIFSGLFNRGAGGQTRSRARRGQDIESEVNLGFTEALDGVTLPLRLSTEGACGACHGTGARAGSTPRVCPTCEGTGQRAQNLGGFAFAESCDECLGRGLVVDDPCPTCYGSGRAQSTKTVHARVPAGVKDGQRIKLKGKGGPGEGGGPDGDLYIVVHVDSHPVFSRSGDNLELTVPVTFDEAALGGNIKVPVLGGGTVTLKLPPGTANGRTFRVRGKGATRRDGSRGDLLVTVKVAVPEEALLTQAAREALAAYRDATDAHNPREGLMAAAGAAGGAR
ncbi:MAG: molecular chaperone DnaJ [Actinobacteria bacterium]|nr:MAG: molecular chaperone DnaJ [Actinomycetota bacterium]